MGTLLGGGFPEEEACIPCKRVVEGEGICRVGGVDEGPPGGEMHPQEPGGTWAVGLERDFGIPFPTRDKTLAGWRLAGLHPVSWEPGPGCGSSVTGASVFSSVQWGLEVLPTPPSGLPVGC